MNLYQFTLDRVMAGDKLNVYLTGTTTAATFYTDPIGATSGTSPLTADSAGLFTPIYLDSSITYRVKVTNSAGSTTFYDIDPVRLLDEGTADGVLLVRSRALATQRKIPANVTMVSCAGYSDKSDRGQALYARVASEPSHAGKFKSDDGTWWELSENVLNPFMFGAKGDDSTNDSPKIQAMFDFMVIKNKPYPFNFMGAKYYVRDRITLPTIPLFVSIDINGGGATLRTDQEIITIFERLATSQANAGVVIGSCHYDIHHFVFQGTAPDSKKTQIGLHIAAAYTNVVRNCWFNTLNYGSIGTFCLASAWRDNLYHFCNQRAAVLQSATGYDNGTVWSDGGDAESPCNVSVFENCRVFGHPDQVSAFGIFASDAVRMNGCISEGNAKKYDVHFDYKGSPTAKNFHVHMFHCEAPTVLNFKVRSSGIVKIDGLVLSRPAAVYDAKGSVNCEVFLKDIAWNNLPVPGGPDMNNPNGRWFYHSNGGGYGGTESGNSSGTQWRFENWPANSYKLLRNPAHWENATLPTIVHVRGMHVDGVMEWSNIGSTFKSPIYFADGSTINGMMKGTVTLSTTMIAPNSEVTETFTVTGLLVMKDVVIVNPYYGYLPPAGLVWNAWVHNDNTMKIRLVNTTGSSITLPSGMVWNYIAPRHA